LEAAIAIVARCIDGAPGAPDFALWGAAIWPSLLHYVASQEGFTAARISYYQQRLETGHASAGDANQLESLREQLGRLAAMSSDLMSLRRSKR
jgi:hypothetical protein